MSSARLGVNIDHVATVRNARGESYPKPLRASVISPKIWSRLYYNSLKRR